MRKDTETIDRLYLELSQFTTAKTRKEIVLETALCDLLNAAIKYEQRAHTHSAQLVTAIEDARHILREYQAK